MNIYTLHQAGSFRPPSHGCDAELENVQREKLPRPNMAVVTDENKFNSSTSQTSETRGSEHSSSAGERTTPRHNVTPTYTNNFANNVTQTAPAPRVSASRIDATGVITGMNKPQVLSSKVAANNHPMAKKKIRNRAYSSAKMTKQQHRQIGLIHIQAKDEFMIFEDNTDLVSHITTPSAVRTSPLETDYLVIDHDEFADEQSLFSAITVPKALRKKKNKKSKKSSKGDVIQEDEAIKVAPSTSVEESEGEEEEEEEEVKTPKEASPPKRIRQNSLDNFKSSNHSLAGSEKGGRTRGSPLRGGKRQQKTDDKAEKSVTPPENSDDANVSSQEESNTPAPHSQEEKVENEEKTKEEVDEKISRSGEEPNAEVVEDKTTEEPQSISNKDDSSDVIPETSKASTEGSNSKIANSAENVESVETSAQKAQPKWQTSTISTDQHSEVITSPESSSARNENYPSVAAKVSTKPNKYKFTMDPIYCLDVTAGTAIDSTARTSNEGSNNEGSNHEGMIHEEPIKEMEDLHQISNKTKRSKSFKASWLLPTTYFCCDRSKKKDVEAVEESMKRTSR